MHIRRDFVDTLLPWMQPVVLVTAFIFFWREAKLGRNELKEATQRMETHLREDMRNMESRMVNGLDRLDGRVARIENIMLEQKKAD